MVSASGVSNTIILSSDPVEVCDRLNYYYLRNMLETILT